MKTAIATADAPAQLLRFMVVESAPELRCVWSETFRTASRPLQHHYITADLALARLKGSELAVHGVIYDRDPNLSDRSYRAQLVDFLEALVQTNYRGPLVLAYVPESSEPWNPSEFWNEVQAVLDTYSGVHYVNSRGASYFGGYAQMYRYLLDFCLERQ